MRVGGPPAAQEAGQESVAVSSEIDVDVTFGPCANCGHPITRAFCGGKQLLPLCLACTAEWERDNPLVSRQEPVQTTFPCLP